MEDYTVGDCPECGGRLYVDTQYPDLVRCDTCDYGCIDFWGDE